MYESETTCPFACVQSAGMSTDCFWSNEPGSALSGAQVGSQRPGALVPCVPGAGRECICSSRAKCGIVGSAACDRAGTPVRPADAGERASKKGTEALSINQRHALISEFRIDYPDTNLERLCQALTVSRSWLYERAVERAPSPEAISLRAEIERVAYDNQNYGYRRITAQLRREGWLVNHKRVHRILREDSLLCRIKRRFISTTDSDHAHRVYPNLLKKHELTGINQAWVADITYIRLPRRFCYLAAILDAFSRRCVGWKLSLDIDTILTLAALDMAITVREPKPGLIHHSDRGVQYAAHDYVKRLESAQALVSMSAKATPYDNAKAERFFRTLKQEEVYISDYQDYRDALRGIEHFIEKVYNEKRLHSRLGYMPPTEFEDTLKSAKVPRTEENNEP